MGNSVSRATRSRSACRWISTAISRCVWLACTTLSAILEPALDRLVSISPSSFNTDAMPVWIAFTTALEAQRLYAEVGGPLAGAYPMGKVWMMHSGEGFALVRAPPEALRAAFAGLFLPAPDRTLAGFF